MIIRVFVISTMMLATAIFSFCSQKQQVVNKLYSVENLKQDFDVFRASLEEGHPALYRFMSKEKMDSLFSATKNTINVPMTDREFVVLLSKLAAQIGDGHLSVKLPKVLKDQLEAGPTALPFFLYWNDNRLYVSRNFSNLSHLADSEFLWAEIRSINGHSTSDFIKDYVSIATSDGNNVTNKYRMLQRVRFFPRYYNMLYGYTESYQVEYVRFNESTVITTQVPGITYEKFFDQYEKLFPNYRPAQFEVHQDAHYAYLKIASFDKSSFKDSKIDYEKFLAKSFKTLKEENINNLILDLRGNGGGTDEYGKILFSYFSDQPFKYYESVQINKESFDFFKYTSHPDMKVPKGMAKPNDQGTFDNIKHPNVGTQLPRLPTFKGNVYVLIDGGCFSTTSEFISVLNDRTDAIFIGEESGGGYYGNTSGPSVECVLPFSKVGVEISLMKYSMAVKEYPYPNGGLIPDHKIIPPIKDKVEKKDVELEFTKSLIKAQ